MGALGSLPSQIIPRLSTRRVKPSLTRPTALRGLLAAPRCSPLKRFLSQPESPARGPRQPHSYPHKFSDPLKSAEPRLVRSGLPRPQPGQTPAPPSAPPCRAPARGSGAAEPARDTALAAPPIPAELGAHAAPLTSSTGSSFQQRIEQENQQQACNHPFPTLRPPPLRPRSPPAPPDT